MHVPAGWDTSSEFTAFAADEWLCSAVLCCGSVSRVRMLRSLGKGKGGRNTTTTTSDFSLQSFDCLQCQTPSCVLFHHPCHLVSAPPAQPTDRETDRPFSVVRDLPGYSAADRKCEFASPWSSHFTAASTGRTGVGRVQAQHGHASAPPDMHASFPLHREWGYARLVKLWLFEKVDAGVVPACEPVGLPPTSLLSFPLHNSLAHPSSHDMQRPPSLSPKSQALQQRQQQQQYSWAAPPDPVHAPSSTPPSMTTMDNSATV
ncbi:hypothetical protein CCHR01_01186 [Colletotrichum chrysophilum]|uniref:Uncharacterized protein n=1 Tax=Colletotrichum chrysophilum TaxID=1836956 RepID=A0AAD9AWY8_9PEZI|nr:hypothetical protein CCHR01_01186 [Colletotrichum chrysophilum]